MRGRGYTELRRAEYAYYGSSETYGNLGDLKTVTVKEGSSTLGTQYFRYYKPGDPSGFGGALKMVVGYASYDRMTGDSKTPSTSADSIRRSSRTRRTTAGCCGASCAGSGSSR